jgi:hypothetical protein
MDPDHGINTIHDATSYHFFRATGGQLFGMLKEEAHFAGQLLAIPCQHRDETEHDGRMAVVTAGVHGAVHLRAVVDVVLLVNGERVDIGAHRDHPAGLGADQPRHHTRFRGSGDVESGNDGQHVVNELRRLVLVKRHFRVAMQVAAPVDDLGGHGTGVVQQGAQLERRRNGGHVRSLGTAGKVGNSIV